MTKPERWREIVASSLDWEQARATFDSAVADMPAELRGKRPNNFPHSAWELVDHLRLTQHDLLDFCTNPNYKAPKWPDDYWPTSPEPPSNTAWGRLHRAIPPRLQSTQGFHDQRPARSH